MSPHETRGNGRSAAGGFGLLLIRVMLGVVFIYHGGQKLFGLFGGHGLGGMTEFLKGLGVPLSFRECLAGRLCGVFWRNLRAHWVCDSPGGDSDGFHHACGLLHRA